MQELKYKNELYAIYDPLKESTTPTNLFHSKILNEKTDWYGDQNEAVQVSRWTYNTGKTFKTHKHKFRPRATEITQECLIVLQGSISVTIWATDKTLLGTIVANRGDVLICYKGYHSFTVLEDNTIAYEIKNGPFTTVEEDKEIWDNG